MKITKSQLKQIIKEELENAGRERLIKDVAKHIRLAVDLDGANQENLINAFTDENVDLNSLEDLGLRFYKRKFKNSGLTLPSSDDLGSAVDANREEAGEARKRAREKEIAASKKPYNPSWERGYGRGKYQGD
tara:strand:- start:13659 stop:14054 length:396 start_codon:yes stop_codon:yes gene_type:complete